MGFLSPWFLAGVAAVGLPIYVHLLRQQKAEPQSFSSLMFFERRVQSSIKHRRLRYLLLMAMRIAIVALLALAFANPFVNLNVLPGMGGKRLVIAAVDNSFSMRAGDHLERAKREASQLLAGIGNANQGQAMAVNSSVSLLSQAVSDPAELRAAVAGIQPTDARSSYAELARALRSLAQSSKIPIDAHLYSDMQRSSMPPDFADLQLPANVQLTVHDVSAPDQPNWFVENVNAPATVYSAKKVRLQATIAGAATPAARRQVTLLLNNRVIETKNVDVPAAGRANVEFLTLEAPYGFNKGEIRIDSADPLKEDDRFFFAIERTDPKRILFVHDGRDTRGPLYYRAALDSSPDSAFAMDAVTFDQAANAGFQKYAMVILSDPSFVSENLESTLRKYVQTGAAVLVAAGPMTGGLKRVPVSGEAVVESVYYARSGDRFQTASEVDPEHPTVRQANRLEGVKFYQATKVEPGKARVIARLSDHTPLLLEQRVGEGRILVFASTFDNLSNDFPIHASFVPFVQQTAQYLSGLEARPAHLSVGAFVELRKSAGQGAAVEVIDPDGNRALGLKEAAAATNFQLAREGFYDLRRGSGRNDMVAANADRRESDLQQVPKETLSLWQNSGHASTAAGGRAVEESKPRSLWWYVMLALLVVALAESLFGSRYLGTEREVAE